MTSVEFTLDDLYNTQAEFALPDGSPVTVRILTDAEVQVRELAAAKAASNVEGRLRDEESEEYQDLIAPLQRLDRDGMIALIMGIATITMTEEVRRDFPFKYIPFPDDANEDERKEVLRQRDEHEARVRQQRSEELSRRLVRRRDELTAFDDDALIARAKRALINTESFNVRTEEFYVQTVYMAARNGADRPVFDLDTVRLHGKADGLNERVFRRVLEIYQEVDLADPWVLQKHP